MRQRANPPLDINKDGYLVNAQFSNWGNKNFDGYEYDPDATLWLHATENRSLKRWLESEQIFSPEKNNFYIGAGGNHYFGRNFVFFRYRPTKIFDPMSESDLDAVIDCVYTRLSSPDVRPDFQKFRKNIGELVTRGHGGYRVDVDFDVIEDAIAGSGSRSAAKSAIKDIMRSGTYTITRHFEDCLKEAGYTSYYELEHASGFTETPDRVNIAVFEDDYDNLEIVGFLKAKKFKGSYGKYYALKDRLGYDPPFKLVNKVQWYICPICGAEFFVDDINAFVKQVIQSGHIGCPDCESR